jgi:flagellar biosynthetic protein FliP
MTSGEPGPKAGAGASPAGAANPDGPAAFATLGAAGPQGRALRREGRTGRLVPALPPLARAAAVAALLLACAAPAAAQELSLDLGDGSLAARTVQILVLVTALSILPGLAVTVTCFPFVVTVLSILRQAIGLQSAPPSMLIVALSLFLTWFIMDPVFQEAWATGIQPFVDGALPLEDAARATIAPFHAFMEGRVSPGTYAQLASLRPGVDPSAPLSEAPLSVLVPSFLLSEIERAFQVGFLVYLPFLVIDLVVAAVLMSMGMMMVPPAIVSLPFKLAFFVVADGWSLVAGSLVRSYF